MYPGTSVIEPILHGLTGIHRTHRSLLLAAEEGRATAKEWRIMPSRFVHRLEVLLLLSAWVHAGLGFQLFPAVSPRGVGKEGSTTWASVRKQEHCLGGGLLQGASGGGKAFGYQLGAASRGGLYCEVARRRMGVVGVFMEEGAGSGGASAAGDREQEGLDSPAADDFGFSEYLSSGVERMMKLLTTGDVSSEEGRLAARKSIIELEQLRNFPFDPSFFSLCVSGEWDLVYSTSRIGVPDSALKVRSIISNLDGQTKNLIHSVGWEYSEAADGDKPGRETMGVFEVKMKYNLSDVPSVPTRMIVGIEEMRLTCTPVNKTPRDPQTLIASLQRALPKEFFDPDESLIDTTYLDPNVRIVCFLGMRFAGVRHVYQRRNMEDLSTAMSESTASGQDEEEGEEETPDWLLSDD